MCGFHFTTSLHRYSVVTSWPEKTLSRALFSCPLIVPPSSVLPIWCIIFSFSLYSFPILLSAFSIYFIKLLLWFNSHQQWRTLCEAGGELILCSHHTCRPAKAGRFTACHTDCLEDALCPHLSRSFHCSPGMRACKLISENVERIILAHKMQNLLNCLRRFKAVPLVFSRKAYLNYKVKWLLWWERGRWWPQTSHLLLREGQTRPPVSGA